MQNPKRVLTGLVLLSLMLSSVAAIAQPGRDGRGQRPDRGPGMMMDKLMERLEESEEGLSYDAVQETMPNMPEMMFDRLDADSDGKLTEDEFENAMEMRRERMEQRRDERPRGERSGPEGDPMPRGERPRGERPGPEGRRAPDDEDQRSSRGEAIAHFRAGMMWGRALERADKDDDRSLSRKEFEDAFPEMPKERFEALDSNDDKVLTTKDVLMTLEDARMWQRDGAPPQREMRNRQDDRPRNRGDRPNRDERPERGERPRRAE